jgi:tetratricopeptide (TPR) repeat protein
VLAQLASVFYNQGRYGEARASLEESLPIFTASGYKYRQAVATCNLGTIILTEGEFGAARRLVTEGLQLSTEIRDAEGRGVAEGVLGEIYRRAGDLDHAEQRLERSLAIAREIEFSLLASDCLLNLVLVACERDNPRDAERLATECLEEARRAGSSFAEARALLGQGIALSAVGRIEEAEAAFESSVARAEEVGVPSLVLEARAGLALAAFCRGALDEAARRVDELVDHLDVPDIQGCLQPGEVYRTCWRVLVARRDPGATAVLRGAGTYLDTIAARIDEDDLRESFLHRVTANAELDGARRARTD